MQTISKQDVIAEPMIIWKDVHNEPIIITGDGKDSRVILSLALYEKLIQKHDVSNAERYGMSVEDLEKVDDDFEFSRLSQTSKVIEL